MCIIFVSIVATTNNNDNNNSLSLSLTPLSTERRRRRERRIEFNAVYSIKTSNRGAHPLASALPLEVSGSLRKDNDSSATRVREI